MRPKVAGPYPVILFCPDPLAAPAPPAGSYRRQRGRMQRSHTKNGRRRNVLGRLPMQQLQNKQGERQCVLP